MTSWLEKIRRSLRGRKRGGQSPRGPRLLDKWLHGPPPDGGPPGSRGSVLIADDDLDLAIAISKRLERLGLRAIRSTDSLHALLGAQRVELDLVILDIQMPSGNGLAVCEMFAEIPQMSDVPVIVYTGKTDAETKRRCRELGAQYVSKSGDSMRALVELTARVLNLPVPTDDPVEATSADDAGALGEPRDPNESSDKSSTGRAVRREFRRRVKERARSLEKSPAEIRIRPMKSDWCSCSPGGRVTFNAALLGKPPEFQNRVIEDALNELPSASPAQPPRDDANPQIRILDVDALDCAAASGVVASRPAAGNSPPPPAANSADEANAPTDPTARRYRLLCVDDDPDISNVLSLRLRPFGVDVLRAYSGMQGFAAALAEQPDAILSDLGMPDGEGTYVFRRLIEHPLTAGIPFLVLTGETNPAVRREVMSSGAAGYLIKPLDFNDLLNHLAKVIPIPSAALTGIGGTSASQRVREYNHQWRGDARIPRRAPNHEERPTPVG